MLEKYTHLLLIEKGKVFQYLEKTFRQINFKNIQIL